MSKEEKPKFHKRRALGIWASTHGKAHIHQRDEAMEVCEYYQLLYSGFISKEDVQRRDKRIVVLIDAFLNGRYSEQIQEYGSSMDLLRKIKNFLLSETKEVEQKE
ncbi:MAG: hypothetical protein KGN01_07705 [Patescibacteria group bacterium]|nr:hypothetical protein [Patescibacteria group bacterium]